MEDKTAGKSVGKTKGKSESEGGSYFKKWYHASDENKKIHRERCNRWIAEHPEQNKKTRDKYAKKYNKIRYAEKVLKTYNYNCVECGSAYITHKKRNIVCDNPKCKKAHQYRMWKKWVENNKDKRNTIARESARKRAKEKKDK